MSIKQDLHWFTGIATGAHVGQVRRYGGEPYVHHPIRVAQRVLDSGADLHTVIAAVLHDVVEDTPCTLTYLRSCGASYKTLAMVWFLTRQPRETHAEYIDRLCAGQGVCADGARLIKRHDIADNRSTLPVGHTLHKRYLRTLEKLNAV